MSAFPTLSAKDKVVYIAALRGMNAELREKIKNDDYGEGEDRELFEFLINKNLSTIERLKTELAVL